MTVPANYDLIIRRGEDFSKTIGVTVKGALINLTGYTAMMQIRQRPDESAPLFTTLSMSNGGIVFTDPVNGQMEIIVPGVTTAGFYWKFGYYDLLFDSSIGLESFFLQGTVRITPRITVGPPH